MVDVNFHATMVVFDIGIKDHLEPNKVEVVNQAHLVPSAIA